jgi:hypothetical protein
MILIVLMLVSKWIHTHLIHDIFISRSYLDHEMAVEFLKRSFLHPGKTKCEEQKREASEKYEERCEPSINKLTGSRYCKIIYWESFRSSFHSHFPIQVLISKHGLNSRTMKWAVDMAVKKNLLFFSLISPAFFQI